MKCYIAHVNYCKPWSRAVEILLVLISGTLYLNLLSQMLPEFRFQIVLLQSVLYAGP